MDNKMIFGYFLQISNHMWEDEENTQPSYCGHDKWDKNNNIDWEVWDEMIDFIAERKYNLLVVDVGDGVILKSHPEIAAPDALTIDELKEKLKKVREKGIEVIPKLNFSACHCVWQKEWRGKMGLPDEYMKFAKDVISEVYEIFDHPRFFHLGLDEETYGHQKYMSTCIVRNEIIYWKEVNGLFDICRELGTKPWIFSDMIWQRKNEFLKHMSKDVLQSNWYYGMFRLFHSDGTKTSDAVRVEAYDVLNENGFDQIPTFSSYSRWLNCEKSFPYIMEHVDKEHLKGMMTIPWHNTAKESEMSLKVDADMFYRARKKYFPETL